MKVQALTKKIALEQIRKALVVYMQDHGEHAPLTTAVQSMIETKAKNRYEQELSSVQKDARIHIGMPLASTDVDKITAQIRKVYVQSDTLALAIGASYTTGSVAHPKVAHLVRQTMRSEARSTMESTNDPSIIDGLKRLEARDQKLWQFWAGGKDRRTGPEFADLIIMNAARNIMKDNGHSFKRIDDIDIDAPTKIDFEVDDETLKKAVSDAYPQVMKSAATPNTTVTGEHYLGFHRAYDQHARHQGTFVVKGEGDEGMRAASYTEPPKTFTESKDLPAKVQDEQDNDNHSSHRFKR